MSFNANNDNPYNQDPVVYSVSREEREHIMHWAKTTTLRTATQRNLLIFMAEKYCRVGVVRIGYKDMVRELSNALGTVSKNIEVLEARGLLKRVSRYRPDRATPDVNEYTLLFPPLHGSTDEAA